MVRRIVVRGVVLLCMVLVCFTIQVYAVPLECIDQVTDSPDAFSPNGDGKDDVAYIDYFLTGESWVSISVLDSSGNKIRTLKDGLTEQGQQQATWDGRDMGGATVDEGPYQYRIVARDVNGNAEPVVVQGSSTVDNHFMEIIEPLAGSTIKGVVRVAAKTSPYIHDETNVQFYYRKKGQAQWMWIGSGTTEDPDGTWVNEWDTAGIENAEYEVAVAAEYYDINNQKRAFEFAMPWIFTVKADSVERLA